MPKLAKHSSLPNVCISGRPVRKLNLSRVKSSVWPVFNTLAAEQAGRGRRVSGDNAGFLSRIRLVDCATLTLALYKLPGRPLRHRANHGLWVLAKALPGASGSLAVERM